MSRTATISANEVDGKPSIHSFIVRMWLEESDKKTRRDTWRGYVTHIPGDERRYFTDVNEITAFITSWLKETK